MNPLLLFEWSISIFVAFLCLYGMAFLIGAGIGFLEEQKQALLKEKDERAERALQLVPLSSLKERDLVLHEKPSWMSSEHYIEMLRESWERRSNEQ